MSSSSLSSAAALAASNGGKLKLLSVHGYLQNAALFREKTGSFRKALKSRLEFVFVDAPYEVDPTESSIAAQSGGTREGGRCWWRWSSDNGPVERPSLSTRYLGFAASLRSLADAIEAEQPDGLMAFSMGATTSSVALAAFSQLAEGKTDAVLRCLRPYGLETEESNRALVESLALKIRSGQLPLPRFALLFGPFQPHDPSFQQLLREAGQSGIAATMPLLFVSGDKDELVPRHRTMDLLGNFPSGRLLTHPGAHLVPTCSGPLKAEIVGFLEGVGGGAVPAAVPERREESQSESEALARGVAL